MPVCYQLVGVPGSGKSTWIKNQVWALGMTVISTDIFVEHYAQSIEKTYSEVFDEYMPTAVRLMTESVIRARNLGHDMIWDQTSTTRGTRKKKFNLLPDYDHVAVVFRTPEPEELKRRLTQRPGKNIPQEILDKMIFNMNNEPVSLSEGFSRIITV